MEKLDTRLVRDMNHLEKQLICEQKGTQLKTKRVCKAAVKSAIIFPLVLNVVTDFLGLHFRQINSFSWEAEVRLVDQQLQRTW